MGLQKGDRYNISCYQIAPKRDRYVMHAQTPIIPEGRPKYRVFNIGRVTVWVEAQWGDIRDWQGAVVEYSVKPGEEAILDVGNKRYYYTRIRLLNDNEKGRALIHCGYAGNGYPWFDHDDPSFQSTLDFYNIARKAVIFGVGKIPIVGEYFAPLFEYFWPENEPSVWEQVKDQISDLIDSRTNETIRGILGGDIRYYKERILSFKLDLDNHKDVSGHYMNIAEDLIGFEKKFSFSKEDNSKAVEINYYLLPLFSKLVSLKMAFYQFGIMNREKIGLSMERVWRLKDYSKRLIEGPGAAVDYINGMFNERMNHELETCNPDNIFNALAVVRTYMGLNGFEYIVYWRNILNHPESTVKPYNDVITYSTVYGRPTPIQARQIVPEEVEQPLQPKLIDGKRNKISGVDIWIWRINQGRGSPKIGGLRLYFENDDTYDMGEWSAEKHYIYFKGAYCTKLKVVGDGALDYLEFTLSDGRVMGYGTTKDAPRDSTVFELEDHHIAGIFLGNDFAALSGQAANITVSYQLTPKE